jgi:hypothetical protein
VRAETGPQRARLRIAERHAVDEGGERAHVTSPPISCACTVTSTFR